MPPLNEGDGMSQGSCSTLGDGDKAPTGYMDALKTEAGGVLGKAFGEDGARERTNVKKCEDKFRVVEGQIG